MCWMISSTLTNVPWLLKMINMVPVLHLSLKLSFTMTISIYYMICKIDTCIYNWYQSNWFKGSNTGYNMKNHLFTPNLRCWNRKEKKRPSHWDSQLLFSPHKPITRWLYIEVMRIMTKTCTICASVIYTSPQTIIFQIMELHKNPRSYTLYNCYWSIEGWIKPTQERDVIG